MMNNTTAYHVTNTHGDRIYGHAVKQCNGQGCHWPEVHEMFITARSRAVPGDVISLNTHGVHQEAVEIYLALVENERKAAGPELWTEAF